MALQYNKKYFYKVGTEEEGAREFFFTTPPAPGPDAPYTFGLIGELIATPLLPLSNLDRTFHFIFHSISVALNAYSNPSIVSSVFGIV